MRVVVFIVWCVVGFCISLAGCRAQLTAEKLEASAEVYPPKELRLPGLEVHHDEDSGGPGTAGEPGAE